MDLSFDQQHIWHPYTSTLDPLPCYPVTRAHGVYLTLENGQQLIDGMSSWWAVIHGYNHPELNRALHQQIDQMAHVMFGGLTHQPAVDLCKQLLHLAPNNLDKVFLSDSGSVAVEVSLKMALQYWQSKGQPRHQFLTLRHGYHGDTFAAMSVTDPDNSMHHIYKGFLPEHRFVSSPNTAFDAVWNDSDGDEIEQQFALHHRDIAAVIIEPIVQGAGGMRFYHPHYLRKVRELCDHYQLLLIADEIATGFGRTGKLFACQHADIEPDILCLGKALTGGYMSMAATLTTKAVADTLCSGEAGCFMHGPTFMANPLACRVASASLSLIQEGKWQQQVQNIERFFKHHWPRLQQSERVKSVRCLGAIAVVETHQRVDLAKIQQHFVNCGVWIRPFGRLIYIMPPYCIEPDQLMTLYHAIESALDHPEFFIGDTQ
ncbi:MULTISPECIES: adenosylmethionine--8-amino-7-oxononanoate transaminase [unclassified Vibrio]|uniref:Adenosylmethionine-8-amino-7-oxononanoate aminotransferase n=1 Tax=Vibrio sp. HB236076 TaxID=3232307 RepID=A0AB39HHY5_9VIBR|nr:adenosylmethionine--8-amino-7-oxononanoate transaminase [Vibrio sp. HB161653]MDP5253663.1 adenosylmethionine--8-amino-7-oxononanoate transaminase [Vibrio sp. HB161653]